jgi:hypothetical protein
VAVVEGKTIEAVVCREMLGKYTNGPLLFSRRFVKEIKEHSEQ